VIRAADLVLRQHAKDLRVACPFVLARLAVQGLLGLSGGLATIAALLDQCWDGLFPLRPRARRGSLVWLIERLEGPLAGMQSGERARLEELGTILGQLREVSRRRFGGDIEELDRLARVVAQIRVDESATTSPPPAPPVPEPPAPAPEPVRPAPSVSVVPPGPLPPVVSAQGVDAEVAEQLQRYVSAAGNELIELAEKIRRARPTDAQAFRLTRVGLWLHVVAPPPLTPEGRTRIDDLREADRSRLEAELQASRWLDLLHRSESLLRTNRFCLDLHWYTYSALRAQGAPSEPAGVVVIAELAALLARFPGLPRLLTSDGKSLADERTRVWIEREVLRSSAPPSAPGPAPTDTPDEGPSIHELFRGRPRDDALARALEQVQAASTTGVRFRRRLDLAEALLHARDVPLAQTLFAGLLDDVDAHRLELWEPALVVRALEGLVRCARALASASSSEAPWLGRLGRLDPGRAARLLAERPQ
jgi:type VI secretion system protein VasJ